MLVIPPPMLEAQQRRYLLKEKEPRKALNMTDDRNTHQDNHHHEHSHAHTHGAIDPSIFTTQRGIWAIKWSFVGLFATAAFQIVIVMFSGSVALLADTIHNIGDAATAVPLWVAFRLARRKPNRRFTYGYGRVEDLAGVAIVLTILLSAIVAGYESIDRFFHPQTVKYLWAVIVASVVGFIGNEAVAQFRIKVGNEIGSAALVADGHHARVDGLTSLAVLFGAVGVWLGYPLADPIVGLLITVAILRIVWESGKSIFTRMLDGVDPEIIEEIRHAVNHTAGVIK
jgi:cation diffusion facilitator family transporter